MVLFLWNIFQRILPRRCWKNPSIVSYCVNHPVKQTSNISLQTSNILFSKEKWSDSTPKIKILSTRNLYVQHVL